MTAHRPMSAQDSLWLTMDRPNNLMVIDGVMLLRGQPAWDDLMAVLRERVVQRFPVFGSRAERVDGDVWAWVPDENFDVDRHVRRAQLPEPARIDQLQEFVAEGRSMPLDRSRPLWELAFVERVVLDDGSVGSALVCRFHHAMADGVRLTMVMLSLCDTHDPAVAAKVAKGTPTASPLAIATAAADLGTEMARDGLRAVNAVFSGLRDDAAGTIVKGMHLGTELVREPHRLREVLDAFDVRNRVANDVSAVAKLLFRGRSVDTAWSGKPGQRKGVAWSAPISLPAVKAAGKQHGASINDVLLTAVAGGLRRYLHKAGDTTVEETAWMVPVNLVPIDENLPEDLGNFFAIVMAVLPLHPADPIERLAVTRHRMGLIKESDEALLTFGIQRGISASPRPVSVALTDYFANKTVGVLTNVPGPRAPMTFADVPVEQVIGFAPCSGDQPMTTTIFSYADTITIGFAVDTDLIPDPALLVEGTMAELDALLESAQIETPV